ncbi:MAG: PadR family transcriptional regulator [Candidatus Aminicenantes bacterium]|nr:PadR family transcriptional regulator [Candidatus Aminicenantes bacterium]
MKELSFQESLFLMVILRLKENAYGVQIKKEIEKKTRKKITYGTLYSSLDQLHRKGLVDRNIGEPTKERGGRRKIYYRVSVRGKIALKTAYELQSVLWKDAPDLLLENMPS